MNEVRMIPGTPIPRKPAALIFYEMSRELELPLVEGALMDQPHIWLLQYGVCLQKETLWKQLNEQAQTQRPTTPFPELGSTSEI